MTGLSERYRSCSVCLRKFRRDSGVKLKAIGDKFRSREFNKVCPTCIKASEGISDTDMVRWMKERCGSAEAVSNVDPDVPVTPTPKKTKSKTTYKRVYKKKGKAK